LRRVHVAVVVGTALVLSGCSVESRPLRQGFGGDDATTTTTTAPTTTTVAGSKRAEATVVTPSAKARTAAQLSALALAPAVLTEDGLEVPESNGAATATPDPLCGKALTGGAGYRVRTRSQSGASKLDQWIITNPAAEQAVAAARKALPCAATEFTALPVASGVDDRLGWCEPSADGGTCTVLLAKDDLVVSLRLDTISVERAQEVLTRLTNAAMGLLAKA
jgi:hypothetical protein